MIDDKNAAADLLDTLLDRLDAMTPEELEIAREKAKAIKFDPNKPIDPIELERKVREWRQREADRLFHGESE